jgi:archaellum component FlaF (FlaF/FlaG flagellin family)
MPQQHSGFKALDDIDLNDKSLLNAERIFFDRFIDIIPWGVSLDGFTITQPANWTVTSNSPVLYIFASSSVAQNSQGGVYAKEGDSQILVSGKKTIVEFYIMRIAGTDTHEAYYFLSNEQNLTPQNTSHLFGFKIVNGAIYGINNNGTTITVTNLGVTVAKGDRLRVEVLQGTYVKFYVNDVLKATVTATLPGAGGYFLHASIKDTQAVPTGFYHCLGRVLIVRKY